jgi:hypothetical protein
MSLGQQDEERTRSGSAPANQGPGLGQAASFGAVTSIAGAKSMTESFVNSSDIASTMADTQHPKAEAQAAHDEAGAKEGGLAGLQGRSNPGMLDGWRTAPSTISISNQILVAGRGPRGPAS